MRYQSTVVLEKEVEDELVELVFEGMCYHTPGRFSGPPEDCYPEDDDAELNFIRSKPPGHTPTQKDFERATRCLWQDAEASNWDDGCY